MSRILYGPKEPDNLSDGAQSLAEYCVKSLKQIGNRTLIINDRTGTETTAAELLKQSIRVAECLAAYGIRVGSKVAICSENRIEYCYVILGTILIGATVVPINWFFSELEMDHSIGLTNPDILFISSSTVNKVLKTVEKSKCIKKVISFDEEVPSSHVLFDDFINAFDGENGKDFICEPQDMKNNVCLILSSSGTTGPSKGVQLTQWNLIATASQLPANILTKVLIPSPFSYFSGFFTIFLTIAKGLTAISISEFDPDTFLPCIQKYKLTSVSFNQSMMNFVAQSALASKYDLSTLRIAFYAGAALAKSNYDAMKKKYPGILVHQAYGSTETCTVTTREMQTPPESVGKLSAGITAVVVNPDTGLYCGPLEWGEIRLKGSKIMKGYIGNPEATKNAFDENGFYKTGDIVYYNEKEEIFIVDRIKELIKYCGMQVYPSEMESVLLTHPSVANVCVIGLPDELSGELPLAFVAIKGPVTEKELVDYVAERLSSPQHLRGGVIFIPEIPTTSSGSGKTYRRTLKELAVKIKNLK